MLTVTDLAQAKALTDVNLIGFVQTFIGQSHSVSEAARIWKLRVDAAYYRVRQLERLGLIAVNSVSQRRGRPVKHYRAISDRFFVPFGIVPEATLEAVLETSGAHFRQEMLKAQSKATHEFFSLRPAGHWGLHIGLDSSGHIDVSLSDSSGDYPDLHDPNLPSILDASPTLQLEPDEAHMLQRELFELMQKYAHRGGSRKYLLHLALAPLED